MYANLLINSTTDHSLIWTNDENKISVDSDYTKNSDYTKKTLYDDQLSFQSIKKYLWPSLQDEERKTWTP